MSVQREATPLVTEFPRVMRGYAPEAVDEFVARIGSRITALQADLAKRTDELTQLRGELSASTTEVVGYRDKEKLLAHALITAEKSRQAADEESEALVAAARAECARARDDAKALIVDAQSQAEALIEEARNSAESLREQAAADKAAIEEEARKQAEPLLAEAHRQAADLVSAARAESDATLADARRDSDALIKQRKTEAAGIEERIARLKSEYEATAHAIRNALDALGAALPSVEDLGGDASESGSKSRLRIVA